MEKIRDRCNVINSMLPLLRKSNSDGSDMNGDGVSFVMCASTIYRWCVNNKRSCLMTIIIGSFIYLF